MPAHQDERLRQLAPHPFRQPQHAEPLRGEITLKADHLGLRGIGTLAQLASPSELLSRPVDAFVAGFVGRDRGYRALGFTRAGTIDTHEERTVAMGASLPAGDQDDWLNLGDEPHGTVVEDRMLYRGGTLATQGGTLRGALDACLSSPSGRGIIVDESGRLVGSTTAREVLALIEALPGTPAVPS